MPDLTSKNGKVTRNRQLATEAIHAGELHDARGAHVAPIYRESP